eukprot:TRINITY_DN8923_c0_g1_i2.p1 TRINITY_DN8923_c0_g1~~TRINITY_DN8923_c0_g1_i2.p1  ORF type:complete len:125 (-),score=42.30 TRINITY_DN8923_c0_g1_i2:80-454(-)
MAREAAEEYRAEKMKERVGEEEKRESLVVKHLKKLEDEKNEKEKKEKKRKRDTKKHDKKDKHKSKTKDSKKRPSKKHKIEKLKPEPYWDRERDLSVTQNDPIRRKKLLQQASELDGRFESTGFL